MGYLITAHVFREKPDFSRLGELPKSIGYRAYLHGTANLYLLDAFRASKVPQYPFQTLIPSADIPLELPPALEPLERLYSRLALLKLANAFKKSYINTALLLNHLLQVPVFSFASDDDELDFACSASDEALSRLKCRCGDLVVSYDHTRLQIAPLVPEAEATLASTTYRIAGAAHFTWQHDAGRDRIELATPLGQTLARLRGSADGVRAEWPDGRSVDARDWDA